MLMNLTIFLPNYCNYLTLQSYELLQKLPNIWDILCKQSDQRSSAASISDEWPLFMNILLDISGLS